MTDLTRYAELEERRRILTARVLELREKPNFTKKKKKEAERMEREHNQRYNDTVTELKQVMEELPFAKAAAELEKRAEEIAKPRDVERQLDNSVIYIDGDTALVLCTDGTIAYTLQPSGTASVGDLALADDLRDFSSLPAERQTELLSGYRKARERRAGQI